MAGLMSLTLIKLGEKRRVPCWACTARLPTRAQAPQCGRGCRRRTPTPLFYVGNLRAAAIDVAAYTQGLVGSIPCLGAALAAALEAGAHAALGDRRATHVAPDRAAQTLACLDPLDVIASAFGYNDARGRAAPASRAALCQTASDLHATV